MFYYARLMIYEYFVPILNNVCPVVATSRIDDLFVKKIKINTASFDN